jgi:sec-independent protein translocase protein TatB
MFDFGFSEMGVIAVVALIVLGPERLPKVARQAGEWLGKLQRYVTDVKSDINRQMELDELRKMQAEVQKAASGIESAVKSAVDETQAQFDSIASSLQTPEGAASEPRTDWDKVYAVRRSRDRIVERRKERAKALGQKIPRRRR